VKAALERELKLESNGAVDLAVLGGSELAARTFTSTYYDTPDRRLLRLGITLRRRLENGSNCWQLKLPGEEGRLELEEPGGPGGPPEPLHALVSAVLRDDALEEVAALKTHRSGRLSDGVEVTVDAVEVLEGAHVVARFTEVEAELRDGGPAALDAVGRRLREIGLAQSDGTSKLARVVGQATPARPARRASTLEHLRAMLGEQHEELLRHDPGARVGDEPEDVHAMRVAVRRLRSVLRSAGAMLDEEWVDGLRAELDWLAGPLGHVRDLDVMTAHLEQEIAQLDGGDATLGHALVTSLHRRHGSARAELLRVLESDRYRALLDAVAAAAAAPRVRDLTARPVELAQKEFRALRKAIRRLPADPPADALHKIRIRGKRARYAAELASRSEGKRACAFVEEAKRFQDVLGEHQDAIVATDALRRLSTGTTSVDAARVAGRLIEREHQRRDAARAAFPKAWKRLRRRGDAWL
jgi:CHAD domain-containing protein